ncbi:CASP-like protein 4D2 isoform X2 [Amborella trichopoda]|uniref:CASP-like protein 4D2 isoform X2 n=1 Tax=Amborella trichopoda TaxID=13333 RepID=UPI0009BCCD10|nr:CASP-like protein 4D2 isoform X2 [Amborella trichopoda]|eukprot:XP_020526172.1 CASP-like protein 4D2 isoform X2 [Amborella trichopoda]
MAKRGVSIQSHNIYITKMKPRYLLSASVIGCAYSLIQIPFAVYWVSTSKRLIRNICLPYFDFYGDKIIALFLASAVGVGFGVTVELKKLLDGFIDSLRFLGEDQFASEASKLDKFFDKGNVSTGFILLAFICMAILSILSSIGLARRMGALFG